MNIGKVGTYFPSCSLYTK